MKNQYKLLIVVLCGFLLASCSSGPGAPFFDAAAPSDTSLTTSVRDAFMQNGEPMLAQVHIQTVESKVILSGYVKKIRQSDLAEQLARKVPGITEVENNIIVRQ